MLEKYKEYGMCVLTSYREGLPLVLLEAKINKLPIISFDIDTGPREIIKDGVNGFLIEPYDTRLMAIKINELLMNEKKRKSFSQNSVLGIEKFRLKEIILKWETLIDELIGL